MSDADIPPPPGPPPDYEPPGTAEAADAERYVAHLQRIGHPALDLREEVGLRVGDWRFYYRQSGAGRDDWAGLDSQGHAIDGYTGGDWYEFLSEPSLDAEGAHRRIAWLLGRPGPVGAGYHFDDSRIDAIVTDPTLDRAGGTATFEGWIVYPPEMQQPHRVRVSAPKGQKATVDSVPVSAVLDR